MRYKFKITFKKAPITALSKLNQTKFFEIIKAFDIDPIKIIGSVKECNKTIVLKFVKSSENINNVLYH